MVLEIHSQSSGSLIGLLSEEDAWERKRAQGEPGRREWVRSCSSSGLGNDTTVGVTLWGTLIMTWDLSLDTSTGGAAAYLWVV